MKIVFHHMEHEGGGVSEVIINSLNYWPNSHDEFVLIHNDNYHGLENFESRIKNKNIEFIGTAKSNGKVSSFMRKLFFPFWFYILYIRAKGALKKIKDPDVLIVHNGSYPGAYESLAVILAAKRLGIKKRMLVVHHGAIHGRILKHPFEKYINYAIQNSWATDLVCVSRASRKTLIDYRNFDPYINPIRVIHNGVDFNVNIKSKHIYGFFEKYNINSECNLVGIIGRIDRYKGHEDLILALDELPTSLKKTFHIIIIGSGSEKEILRLKNIAKYIDVDKQIHFTGYLEGDIKTWINQLNLVVMLTKDFEGFGLTILEAMAVGIPVIATTVGGVTEFINENNGWLIPPESPESLADVLVHYNSFQDQFIEIAKNAKEDMKKFDAKTMAYRYHRLVNL